MTNGAIALFIGIYLIVVAARGNSESLGQLLAYDKGFLLWLLAAYIASVASEAAGAPMIGKAIIGAAFLAFVIQSGGKAAETLSIITEKLKGQSS